MNTIESETQKPEKKQKLFWLEKLGMKTHNRKFWNSDKFLSLFAFLISVGTFATFAYQTYLIREQQYASVMPYLMISNWTGSQEDYSLNLANNGIGPAFIKNVKVHYEGKTYNFGPQQFIVKVIYPKNPINFGGTSIDKGFVIPAGQTYVLVDSNNKKAKDMLGYLFGGGEKPKVTIEITYSSIYDETWVIKGTGAIPIKLE